MNANALWAGNHYALVEGRGRNDAFNMFAKRVSVKRVIKEQVNDRARALVDVIMCEDDGKEIMQYGEPYVRQVRARDIIDHWEDYEHERKVYRDEAEERNRVRAAAEAQRVAAQRARDEEAQYKRTRILDALEAKGIPRHAVTIASYPSGGVTITRTVLERWLGLDDQ